MSMSVDRGRPLAVFGVVVMLFSACGQSTWVRQPVEPKEAISAEQLPIVRLTMRNGSEHVLRYPTVQDDSVVGRDRSGRHSAVPLDEVERVATLSTSEGRAVVTIAMIVGALALLGLIVSSMGAFGGPG
jgi:hypothetical protein